MPKQPFHIREFRGMTGAEDPRDRPPGVAAFCQNLHVGGRQGRVSNLRAPEEVLSSAWFQSAISFGEEGRVAVTTGSAVKVYESFHEPFSSASVVFTSGTLGNVQDLSTDGQAARIARPLVNRPQWIGKVDGSWVEDDTRLRTGSPSDGGSPTEGTTSSEGYFQGNWEYHWHLSLVYEYAQEGPLSDTVQTIKIGSSGVITVDVPFELTGSEVSGRVTHVRIYRREHRRRSRSPSSKATARHIEDVPIGDWTDSGGLLEYTYTDEGGPGGATYEERTGIPATLDHMDVRYELSATLEGYHFVSKAEVDGVESARSMIFRSKAYRHDTFDWSKDYVRLPAEPVALVPYQGRLWALSEARVFRINPSTLAIEDDWDGPGVTDRQAVVATERGLFFASDENIFFHDGRFPVPIGDPILRVDDRYGLGWLERTGANSDVVRCTYDPAHDYYLLLYQSDTDESTGDNKVLAWAFHPETREWTHLDLSIHSGVLDGTTTLPTGEVLMGRADSAGIYRLFSGSPQEAEWTSAPIPQEGRRSVYYSARTYVPEGGAEPTLEYREDWGAWQSPSAQSGGDDTYTFDINSASSSPHEKVRTFQVRLSTNGRIDELVLTRRLLTR